GDGHALAGHALVAGVVRHVLHAVARPDVERHRLGGAQDVQAHFAVGLALEGRVDFVVAGNGLAVHLEEDVAAPQARGLGAAALDRPVHQDAFTLAHAQRGTGERVHRFEVHPEPALTAGFPGLGPRVAAGLGPAAGAGLVAGRARDRGSG